MVRSRGAVPAGAGVLWGLVGLGLRAHGRGVVPLDGDRTLHNAILGVDLDASHGGGAHLGHLIRFDRLVHAFGFGFAFATLACRKVLRRWLPGEGSGPARR